VAHHSRRRSKAGVMTPGRATDRATDPVGSEHPLAGEAKAIVVLDDVVFVLPRDPVAAAEALAEQLGGKVFAYRWAKALFEAAR